MIINIDTAAELSDLDRQILGALTGDTPEPEKPKATRTRKAAEPTPEPTPKEEPEIDPLGTDEPTIEDAVKRATELVSEKKSDVVKEALKNLDVKRVSELTKPGAVEKFLAELADA